MKRSKKPRFNKTILKLARVFKKTGKTTAQKIPPLKLPRSLFGLRTLYAALHNRLKQKSGMKMKSVTVFQIRDRSQSDTRREMSVLRQMCKLFHRLIHQPLTPEDAVPETVGNRL